MKVIARRIANGHGVCYLHSRNNPHEWKWDKKNADRFFDESEARSIMRTFPEWLRTSSWIEEYAP